MKPDGTELTAFYGERLPAVLASIKELVDIESPSLNVVGSEAAADWVEARFRATGVEVEVERFRTEGVGDHLIIRAFPGTEKPVLLLGHTDTVHPMGTALENPSRIENGRFYGCGIFDMKANIVLMAEALQYFHVSGKQPSRPINILLSCDEEVGSMTGRAFVEAEAGKAAECYVFEPSAAGRVKTGRKGTAVYTIKAHGIPAHAGLEPERGANAIFAIASAIDFAHSLARPELGTTANVCLVSGGTASNVIPEHARCSVDVRFKSAAEAERVDSLIRSFAAKDPRVSIEVDGGINRPPMERTPDVAALYLRAAAIAGTFGYELGETEVGGASDGNFVAAAGTPVLDGLGISGDGAHTLQEYINIDDIVPRAALVTGLLS